MAKKPYFDIYANMLIEDRSNGGTGGGYEPDNTTIKLNSQDKLQAHGLIDKNKGNVTYDWIGTIEEYERDVQSGKIQPNFKCYITNDTSNIVNDYNTLINLPSVNGNELKGNKTSSDLGLASKTELDSKMIRYIIKLIKNGDTYSIQTYDGTPLDFATLSTQIKNTSNYVVMVYGNSKLRPQYVSTNEMMFTGIDRSQNTKVLRVVFTPTRCSYETFELVETSDLLEKSTEQWQFTLSTGEVVERKVVLGE